ncbi:MULTISPECIES: fimbrial protein [Providencia]|uniref:Fimbrial protein n=1 Tax=Providencia manganoxydans TaxID=2923283 RepID=A0ABX7AIS1_9GAMM|nr:MULTISPECIES: hypothetical protein [Providencia]MDX4945553.1 hypothetical protein [Providencia manganoxydans]QQO63194.1 fimbrial protein [Providencia manganoxydans]
MQRLKFHLFSHKQITTPLILALFLCSFSAKPDDQTARFLFTIYVEQELCDVLVTGLEQSTNRIDFGSVSFSEIKEQSKKAKFNVSLDNCTFDDLATSKVQISGGSLVNDSQGKVFNTDKLASFGVAIKDDSETTTYSVGDVIFNNIQKEGDYKTFTAVLACSDLGNSCEEFTGDFSAFVTFSYYSD